MSLAGDLRFGLRMLRRSPGFTAVAAITLALGIGVNTAIFSVVNAVLLEPLPYHDPGSLETVWGKFENVNLMKNQVSIPELEDLRHQSQAFASLAAYETSGANLTGGDRPVRVEVAHVTANTLATLGVAPARGRDFRPEEEEQGKDRVAILSRAAWKRWFAASPDAVGKAVNLDGEEHRIIGVMPAGFRFPFDESIDVWTPLSFREPPGRGNHSFRVIGRRKPGVSHAEAKADVALITSRMIADNPDNYPPAGFGLYLVPLPDELVGQVKPVLLVLLGAVAFVLLIACANVANLLLARASARRRELALRSALGARRSRLIMQLLIESLLLSLLGGALGLLLAVWGVDLLAALSPAPELHPDGIPVDATVLGFTLALTFATGVGFGLVPALHASRTDLAAVLKDGDGRSGTSPGARRLRRVFVVAEVALALLLVAGAGLMLRSFSRIQAIDAGFEAGGVTTLRIDLPYSGYEEDAPLIGFVRALEERLAATPGVAAVGMTSHRLMSGKGWSGGYQVLDYDGPVSVMGRAGAGESARRVVTPGYFDAMEIPLVAGRVFTAADDADAPHVVVVDELFARRLWPDRPPDVAVGRRLHVNGEDLRIIGVVRHARDDRLISSTREQTYFAYAQLAARWISLVVRSKLSSAAVAAAAQEVVSSLDPAVPVHDVRSLDELVSRSLARRRFALLLLLAFGIVALVLAAVGIYGVMAYSVTRRTHEIGVRVALGARPRQVLAMVVRQGVTLAALGLALGLVAAALVGHVAAGALYGVSSTDPITLLLVAALLFAVAAFASWVPARRAARIDPMEALRYE